MNRQTVIIVITQLLGTTFGIFAFGITIFHSNLHAPGGSLLNVLTAIPDTRVPLAFVGGLYLALVLASLALYPFAKRQSQDR